MIPISNPWDAGELVVWGNPWHGWVKQEVLHLPNGASKPGPVSPISSDGNSDCLLVRVPGAALPLRNAQQMGDDLAAGREWRSYVLLGGAPRCYGKLGMFLAPLGSPLGGLRVIAGRDIAEGWVLAVAPGRVFMVGVDMSVLQGDATAAWTLRAKRINRHVYGAPVSGAFDFVTQSGTGLDLGTENLVGATWLRAMTISPDGRTAIFVTGRNAGMDDPLNFVSALRLDITGTPDDAGNGLTANWSVLKSYTQMNPPAGSTVVSGPGYVGTRLDVNWQTVSGVSTYSYGNAAAVNVPVANGGTYKVGSETATTVSVRPVGFMFDRDGTLHDVTMSMTTEVVTTLDPPSVVSSGTAVLDENVPSASGTAGMTITQTARADATETWRYTCGPHQVTRVRTSADSLIASVVFSKQFVVGSHFENGAHVDPLTGIGNSFIVQPGSDGVPPVVTGDIGTPRWRSNNALAIFDTATATVMQAALGCQSALDPAPAGTQFICHQPYTGEWITAPDAPVFWI